MVYAKGCFTPTKHSNCIHSCEKSTNVESRFSGVLAASWQTADDWLQTNSEGEGCKILTNSESQCPHHLSPLTGFPMHEFKAGKTMAGFILIWHPSCRSVLWFHCTVSTIRCFGNWPMTSVRARQEKLGPIWHFCHKLLLAFDFVHHSFTLESSCKYIILHKHTHSIYIHIVFCIQSLSSCVFFLRLQSAVWLHQIVWFHNTACSFFLNLYSFFTQEMVCKLENWKGLQILFPFHLLEGPSKSSAASCLGVSEFCVLVWNH